MAIANETVNSVRDDATGHLYFQISQADGGFYLCDHDSDKVDLASWTLVETLGTIPSDDDDAFFALIANTPKNN